MTITKITYWVCTILLCLVMAGSGINALLQSAKAQEMMVGHLHYPTYFSAFISIAKILGAIAILTPGFPKLKEWAYAGFTFDLIGATYSAIAVGDPASQWGFMAIFFALLIGSYISYHKLQDAKS